MLPLGIAPVFSSSYQIYLASSGIFPNILPNTHIRLVLVGIVRSFSIPYPYLACLVGIVRSFSIPYPHLACLVGIVRLFSIPYPYLACLVGIVRSFSIPYPHLSLPCGYRALIFHSIPSSNQTPRVSYLLIHCHTQKSSIIKQ